MRVSAFATVWKTAHSPFCRCTPRHWHTSPACHRYTLCSVPATPHDWCWCAGVSQASPAGHWQGQQSGSFLHKEGDGAIDTDVSTRACNTGNESSHNNSQSPLVYQYLPPQVNAAETTRPAPNSAWLLLGNIFRTTTQQGQKSSFSTHRSAAGPSLSARNSAGTNRGRLSECWVVRSVARQHALGLSPN